MEKKHDYRDTIEEAKDLTDAHEEEAKKRDSELAFEAIAAATSMGLFGTDEQVAALIDLQLAKQLSRRLTLNETDFDGNKAE
ncbi:MAG: hypothetical protein J1F33_02550 [Clostridiales bacterium]|nr:hypothetical protein [Clostridiales bacterium]